MAYVKDSYDNLSIIMSDTKLHLENLAKLYWNRYSLIYLYFGTMTFIQTYFSYLEGFSLIMNHFYEFHFTQKTVKCDFYTLISN